LHMTAAATSPFNAKVAEFLGTAIPVEI